MTRDGRSAYHSPLIPHHSIRSVMEIAFIVDEFPSVSETFVLNQIVGLLERGHRVDVYAHVLGRGIEHPDIGRFRLRERVQRLGCPRTYWARLGAAVRLASAHAGRPQAMARALNVARYGRRALSLSLLVETAPFHRRYDIVHCQFGHNGRFGAVLKQLGLQRKLVVTFHGWDIRAGLERGGAIYDEVWRAADCLIAISRYNREQLLRLGAEAKKITEHPVGIDCRRFAYRAAASGRRTIRLVTVARLVEEKGIAIALEALALLGKENPAPEIQYEIVGDGPLRATIERTIAQLGLSDRVRLSGALSQDGVIAALQAADVFLLPSLVEALPVSLMEAHAIGLPALATRVGSVEQIVQENVSGLLVPAGDAAALAVGLRQLIARREEWPDMSRAGRRRVETHYDIDRLNDRLVEIYRHVLAA